MSFGNIYRNKTKRLAYIAMVFFAILIIIAFPVINSIKGSMLKGEDQQVVEESAEYIVQVLEPEQMNNYEISTTDADSKAEPTIVDSSFVSQNEPPYTAPLAQNNTDGDSINESKLALPQVQNDYIKDREQEEQKPSFFDGILQLFGLGGEEEDVPNTVSILRNEESCRTIDNSEVTGSTMTVTSATTLADINTWIAGLSGDDNLLTFAVNFELTGQISSTQKNLTIQGLTGSEVITRSATHTGHMVYLSGGDVVVSNIIFDGTSPLAPVAGKIIQSYSNAKLYIEGCAELRNNNSTGSGGAISANPTEITIDGGYIHHNTSAGSGGGIYTTSSLVINGGEISNNSAPSSGGGIYGTNITMNDGYIHDNSTEGSGGGIFGSNSVTMNGGTISSNSAMTHYDDVNNMHLGGGGGVCANDIFTINGGTIEDNEATPNLSVGGKVGSGGGVFTGGAIVTGGVITNNNANQGGGITMVTEASTFDMTGGEISYNNVVEITTDNKTYNGIGGGILAGDNASISGGEIHNNTAGYGGGFYTDAHVLISDDALFYSNTVTASGGAIYSGNGVEMTGGVIGGSSSRANTSTNWGGGIYSGGGTFTMTGGEISYNEATNESGGGANCADDTIISLSGGEIHNNTSKYGGGVTGGFRSTMSISNNILLYSNTASLSGGGVYTNGSLTMTGGVIGGADNKTNTANNGGGIYVPSNETFTMTGGEISYNLTLLGSGGGIFGATNSTMTISGNSLIHSNTAKSHGGGIFGASSSTLTISDDVLIYSNDASDGGGVSGSTVNISDDVSIYENTATGYGGGVRADSILNLTGYVVIHSNESSDSGGGIYVGYQFDISGNVSVYNNTAKYGGGMRTNSSNDTSLKNISGNATFYSNTATVTGGAIWSNTTLNISENVVIGGSASRGNTAPSGGGILQVRLDLNISGGEISYNTADYGGGVYLNSSTAIANISDSALLHSNAVTASGGAIYANGPVNITGGVIGGSEGRANTASWGGGVYVVSGQTLTMTSGEISYNTALANSGGAINGGTPAEGGVGTTFNISGGIIHHNAAKFGGGVSNGTYSTTNISDNVSIYSNTAEVSGGGIYSNGAVNISGGVIGGSESRKNTAFYAGGVFVNNQTITMTGGEISYNTASQGGGMYSGGGVANLSGGKISNNVADTTQYVSGAGVFTTISVVNVSGTEISNNRATGGWGGGIGGGQSDCEINISGTASLHSNSATASGGGVYSNGAVNITGGTIGGSSINANTSSNGGGIYVGANKLITISGGEISYNTGAYGGGVYAASNTTTTISGNALISYNSATSYGGGVYSVGLLVNMTGGEVSHNTNSGLYSNNGTINVSSGGIHHNQHTFGGGVYGNTNSTINISGEASIYSNTASSSGGAIYSNGSVNITGGVIGGSDDRANVAANGGGITVNTQSLTISGGEISYNRGTTRGGGLYGFSTESTVTISGDAIISHNTAVAAGGMQINGIGNINGGSITYNTGTNTTNTTSGIGGVSTGELSIINMAAGIISNNTGTAYGGGIDICGILNLSGGLITNNTTTAPGGNGVYFHETGTLNLSGNPQIGIDNDDNGVWFAQGKEATVIGDLDATARINIEGVVTDTDVTVIANKIDNETNQTPVNAFQTEAEKFVYIPGLTSDPIVSVIPSTTTYILSDPLYIDLEITGDTNIDITPSFNHSNGVVSSIKQTASFTTNIVTGVTMSISLDGTTSDLVNAVDNTRTVPSINSTIDSPSQLTANTWGFGLTDRILETNNSNSTTTWAKLPNQSDANPSTVIKTTSIHNRTEPNTTDIFFGAKINTDQLAGTYLTTLIYTIVGNL